MHGPVQQSRSVVHAPLPPAQEHCPLMHVPTEQLAFVVHAPPDLEQRQFPIWPGEPFCLLHRAPPQSASEAHGAFASSSHPGVHTSGPPGSVWLGEHPPEQQSLF
jgi:hypothetical protein